MSRKLLDGVARFTGIPQRLEANRFEREADGELTNEEKVEIDGLRAVSRRRAMQLGIGTLGIVGTTTAVGGIRGFIDWVQNKRGEIDRLERGIAKRKERNAALEAELRQPRLVAGKQLDVELTDERKERTDALIRKVTEVFNGPFRKMVVPMVEKADLYDEHLRASILAPFTIWDLNVDENKLLNAVDFYRERNRVGALEINRQRLGTLSSHNVLQIIENPGISYADVADYLCEQKIVSVSPDFDFENLYHLLMLHVQISYSAVDTRYMIGLDPGASVGYMNLVEEGSVLLEHLVGPYSNVIELLNLLSGGALEKGDYFEIEGYKMEGIEHLITLAGLYYLKGRSGLFGRIGAEINGEYFVGVARMYRERGKNPMSIRDGKYGPVLSNGERI